MTLFSKLLAKIGLRREAAGQPIAPPPAPPAVSVSKGVPAGAPPLSPRDRDTLIRTLYGEARGEPKLGQIAVVHVIRNRVIARGTDAHTECRRPMQFSCWNMDDPNRLRIIEMPAASLSYEALGLVVDAAWTMTDTVDGARHYYAINGMVDQKPPRWASHPKARIVKQSGGHTFVADVP